MQKLILFLVLLVTWASAFAQNCPDPDTLAPVIVCRTVILIGIIPATCGAVLPVETVLDSVLDDCSPPENIQLSIRLAGTGLGFPLDSAGNPLTSLDLYLPAQQVVVVELWARDAAGNSAYCQATINVWDPEGECLVDVYAVGGLLRTDSAAGAEGVEDVLITLEADAPDFPAFSLYQQTGQDGRYLFNNVLPENTVYRVTPYKDDNPLNGVTTYDLVLVTRHILGLEPLSSPYKIISADANKSGTVTTVDIITLRKMILGLNDHLPGNTSWRFVDRGFVFPNADNPFQTVFPESVAGTIDSFDLLNDDFVGLKVGDVNESAIPNSSFTASDDRSAGTLHIDLHADGAGEDRRLEAGVRFSVRFSAVEAVLGFQFTLNTSSLEVLDIQPGRAMSPENFAVFPEKAALTASWNAPARGSGHDRPAFTVTFRATKTGRLSEMLDVSSRITKAEAYQEAESHRMTASHPMTKLDVELRFNGETLKPSGIVLDQNEPNPFANSTSIGFRLPEAGAVKLTVFDSQGRRLLQKEDFYESGYHKMVVDGSGLAGGMLYYRLESAAGSACRSMMLVR